MSGKSLVWIIMGSDSDLKVMSEAAKILDSFQVPFTMSIASAHRTPDYISTEVKEAARRGVKVIIAGAGLAAHLPGVIAAATRLPVIGVPLQSGALAGSDALYSIVQMPPGIPVATVGINGAQNAGILAAQILSIADTDLAARITAHREQMRDSVLTKNEKLQKLGYKDYLEGMK